MSADPAWSALSASRALLGREEGSVGMVGDSPDLWDVSAPPVVRWAGLPAAALVDLRCDELFRRIDGLLSARDRLAADATALAGDLYPVVGAVSDSDHRSALIGLRRALKRQRRPTQRDWNPTVAAMVPAALASRVNTWIEELTAWRSARAELPDTIDAHWRRQRAELRKTLAHHGLRRALAKAAAPLLDEVERWLADGRRAPQRQKLLRVAKYVARGSAKTSPYSTFMMSGFGAWTEHGPALAYDRVDDVRGVLQVGGGYLGAVRWALARRPELAAVAPVRVNPTAVERDGAIQYVAGDRAESIVTVTVTPALRECLQLIADDDRITLADLRRGLTAAVGGDRAERVDAYLDRLVASGLLEPFVPVADHAEDWFGAAQQWLQPHADERLSDVVKLLGLVRDELRRVVPVADIVGHRARLLALNGAMTELADRLDLPGSVGQTPGAGCYETAVVERPVVRCAVPQWRPALEDLDVLRQFFSIFDDTLPRKVAVGTFFRERFGAGSSVPLLTLYRAVQEEQDLPDPRTDAAADMRGMLDTSRPWVSALGAARLARLRQLDQLRVEARQLIGASPAGEDGVARVSTETLRASMAKWPNWVVVRSSVGCYVQPRMVGADLHLVLNLMACGHGHSVARLRHLLGLAGEERELGGPGVVFAELGGLLRSTLNVRSATVRHEIGFPLAVSARAESDRIALAELMVSHDPDTDLIELYAPRLAANVVPLHLGTLAAISLPPVARFLAQVFAPGGQLGHPAMPPTIDANAITVSDSAVCFPRVEVGRVAVRRARWVLPSQRVPQRAQGESDSSYLLRLVTWRRADGIPARCFVRIWSDPDRVVFTKARKPLYVDFTSLLSIYVFEREVRSGRYVMFDEELPAMDEAQGPDPAEPSAVEMLVEITRAGPDG